MPLKLLDPTLDITFKLLLLRNRELLRDMIEAVLGTSTPIEDLVVLNPEIPREFPADKTIVLDIRVRFQGGRQVDLEMQSTFPPGTRARFLYYWARTFADGMASGDAYSTLRPCISILWFKDPFLQNPRFHSVFHLSEDHCREVFSPEIEFHVLELPKLHWASADRQARLERWARFLRAETIEDLEELAREDAMMNTAKNALEELSADSDAQRLARERETAVLVHRHLIGSSIEKGRAEGRVEGRVEGVLLTIGSMCKLLGIELDEVKSEQLRTLDVEQLVGLVERLESERRWPEGI